MPATLNALNSDSEDKDLTNEKDEENHVDPEEAKSSPHTLHAKKARRRNGDSTEFQEEKARAFLQNQKANGSQIRSKVTIVDLKQKTEEKTITTIGPAEGSRKQRRTPTGATEETTE